jgi:ribosomal protein S18 acetylase RimI-like enzyme
MLQPDTSATRTHLKVRRLDPNEFASYREIRLEGLKNHPEAFSASWEIESANPTSWWVERLETNIVFGSWIEPSRLGGVVGFRMHAGAKIRHKGILWGMYVRPEARGTGLARSLVHRVIELARASVDEILLTVVASNVAACRLYRRAGFEQYGLERRALKIGNEHYDEALMALSLRGHE